jgi:lipoate-protein ligase A
VTSQNKVDFKKYLAPIVAILNKAGIPAEIGERNNLLISEMKISGNAEHIYKDKVLHHGTLLFSTDLYMLNKALQTDASKYSGKAVRSVKSRVTNISDHSNALTDINAFATMISTNLSASFEDCVDYKLSETDIHAINALAQEKYAQWYWNFGYSPAYSFNNRGIIKGKEIIVSLEVEQGMIRSISIEGNCFDKELSDTVSACLKGIKHEEESIKLALNKPDIWNKQNDINFAAFVNLLF